MERSAQYIRMTAVTAPRAMSAAAAWERSLVSTDVQSDSDG